MTPAKRLASIVRGLFRRSKNEAELDDELRTFIEIAAAEKMKAGIPESEARRLAMLELGGLEQVKEQVRTGRHGAMLEELLRDARHAFRVFARAPVLTLTIVVTLALGIGANTAIFSLIDSLMLRWLPVPNPQELVRIGFPPDVSTLFIPWCARSPIRKRSFPAPQDLPVGASTLVSRAKRVAFPEHS